MSAAFFIFGHVRGSLARTTHVYAVHDESDTLLDSYNPVLVPPTPQGPCRYCYTVRHRRLSAVVSSRAPLLLLYPPTSLCAYLSVCLSHVLPSVRRQLTTLVMVLVAVLGTPRPIPVLVFATITTQCYIQQRRSFAWCLHIQQTLCRWPQLGHNRWYSCFVVARLPADKCSRSCLSEGLRKYFSEFGEVEDCTILRDQEGRSRGFAFLTFRDPSSVNAVMVREHVLDGKAVRDPSRTTTFVRSMALHRLTPSARSREKNTCAIRAISLVACPTRRLPKQCAPSSRASARSSTAP